MTEDAMLKDKDAGLRLPGPEGTVWFNRVQVIAAIVSMYALDRGNVDAVAYTHDELAKSLARYLLQNNAIHMEEQPASVLGRINITGHVATVRPDEGNGRLWFQEQLKSEYEMGERAGRAAVLDAMRAHADHLDGLQKLAADIAATNIRRLADNIEKETG